jgi:ABC-type maltose transport system permease subunit
LVPSNVRSCSLPEGRTDGSAYVPVKEVAAKARVSFQTLAVIGGLVTIIPLIALFLVLQRYWRSGLLLGSIAS